MQHRKAALTSDIPWKQEAGSNNSGDRLWEGLNLGLKRQLARYDHKLLEPKRLLVWEDQVWPRTKFFMFPFLKKINDPLTGKHFFSFLPPSNILALVGRAF